MQYKNFNSTIQNAFQSKQYECCKTMPMQIANYFVKRLQKLYIKETGKK